jgi:uncharacterized protein
MQLSPEEQRILGVLMEKQITTPNAYPMTANALLNGCNQKNSRWPVVSYSEGQMLRVLDGLRDRLLSTIVHEHGARVPKYAQLLVRELRLEPPETAILTVLLLRGPQTPGELRSRAEPLHGFKSLGEVEATLNELVTRRPHHLACQLPRQSGMREQRYAHLLGDLEAQTLALEDHWEGKADGKSEYSPESSAVLGRLEQVEQELTELRQRLAVLEELLK